MKGGGREKRAATPAFFPLVTLPTLPPSPRYFGSSRGRAACLIVVIVVARVVLPLLRARAPPRQGKQCLISVNAAIMVVVPSGRARGTSTPGKRDKWNPRRHGAPRGPVCPSTRIWVCTCTYGRAQPWPARWIIGLLSLRGFHNWRSIRAQLRMRTITCDRRIGGRAVYRRWSSDRPVDRSTVRSADHAPQIDW